MKDFYPDELIVCFGDKEIPVSKKSNYVLEYEAEEKLEKYDIFSRKTKDGAIVSKKKHKIMLKKGDRLTIKTNLRVST